jgi:hypothetical protein
MMHLKKYESFSEEDLYNKWKGFIDSLIEIFEEFEDEGWHWSTGSKTGKHKSISLDWPEFNCIMLKDEEFYIPAEKNYNIDYTGNFKNGEIIWDTKDFNYKEKNKEVIRVSEESKDFIVAIKRLNELTGVDFSFSYNNKGGESRIVIRGFVKIKFN